MNKMRTIKFRAWDKRNKEMGTQFTLQQAVEEQSMDSKDIAWLQFTGLKDKNGKEIYQGDIVRITCKEYVDGVGEKVDMFDREVIYEEEVAAFMPFNDGFYPDENYCVIEVIGNIYENPELLK